MSGQATGAAVVIDEAGPAALSVSHSRLWPGILVVVAGAVQGDGALITAVYRGASTVSDDQLSFPWHGATATTTSLIWGAAQVLLVAGFIAFARDDVPRVRSGRIGARLAVVGAGLYVVGHVVSAIASDAALDDPAGFIVLSSFGVGTVLTMIGMLMTGVAVLRHGRWTGWRRFTPVAVGAWMVAMIPLQFTAALPLAVAVYAVAVAALGVAMIGERARIAAVAPAS